ncbi:MAG: hypothetical protein HYR96_11870 [Deltaproteobacteria bacterium]|nr:hypothetical protein [Deltaproteobacteria bacterium]MBI3295111.1 hypothetical protein [Deltaproteobacteria bacterium]
MKRVVFFALVLALNLAFAGDVILKGGKYTLVIRASHFANLLYQLNQIDHAPEGECDVFHKLWNQRLGLNANDKQILEELRATKKKYAGSVDLSAPKSALPLWGNRISLRDRIAVAAYSSDNLDDDKRNLRNLMLSGDVELNLRDYSTRS